MFWGVDKAGRRIPLEKTGATLKGGEFSLNLNPESINNALLQKQIYPGSLVCFLVLLYYNLTCLGGFNQVNWLSEIKFKFAGLLGELGEAELSENISKQMTENFAEGSVALLVNNKGQIYRPTAVDIFLQNRLDIYQKFCDLARRVTVAESIDFELPEIYRIVMPEGSRSQDKENFTGNSFGSNRSLQTKVKSIFLD